MKVSDLISELEMKKNQWGNNEIKDEHGNTFEYVVVRYEDDKIWLELRSYR